jgi:hypothetical protein
VLTSYDAFEAWTLLLTFVFALAQLVLMLVLRFSPLTQGDALPLATAPWPSPSAHPW